MAQHPPPLEINPPLINSSNPWATSLDDLKSLYACPSTGAVTTRTSLLKAFAHDPAKHQYAFFNAATHQPPSDSAPDQNASLNCLGYSPITLEEYLGFIGEISDGQPAQKSKGFIVSVTGTPDEVADSYKLVAIAQSSLSLPLAVEVNLSCPNIPNKPPPAYSKDSLVEYLGNLQGVIAAHPALPRIPFGLKTPPYTHSTEYEALITALEQSADDAPGGVSPVSFITATNTLGSCLVISTVPDAPVGNNITSLSLALPGTGTGGMAGAPLHPLALGNVMTLRRMLDERKEKLGHIRLIGIGGVLDEAGYRRMKAVGAAVIGVGTGLGLKGVTIFDEIEKGLDGKW